MECGCVVAWSMGAVLAGSGMGFVARDFRDGDGSSGAGVGFAVVQGLGVGCGCFCVFCFPLQVLEVLVIEVYRCFRGS